MGRILVGIIFLNSLLLAWAVGPKVSAVQGRPDFFRPDTHFNFTFPDLPLRPPVRPPVPDPEWSPWPVQRQRDGGSGFYADVMNHSRGAPFSQGDRDTRAHETTHGINSEIRMSLLQGRRGNGYYVGRDMAVLLDEPRFKLADLIPFIPRPLRGNRFKLYLEEQQSGWNDMPSYIFDEGVAYLNGSRVSVEEAVEGETGKTDAVHSCAEFSIYCTAFLMAAQKHDPDYFANNKQARLFLAWYVREAIGVYRSGQRFSQFRWDEKYYEILKTGEDGRPIRDFWEKELGVSASVLGENCSKKLPLPVDI
jgi:hypothetical protein